MKILSWNVNWIRAVIQKWFFDWVKENDADIICLQEVKAFEIQIPSEIRFHMSDYDYLWHKWTRPWYAWTAIFFKKWIKIVEKKSDFPFHEFSDEGRVTEISYKYDGKVIHLLNVYFPNWWDRADGTEMLSYKLDFYEKMRQYARSQAIKKNYATNIQRMNDEEIANLCITLIHQAVYMLHKLLQTMQDRFVREGGIKERMFQSRVNYRNQQNNQK